MALIEREALENKRMEMPLNPGYVDVVSWEAIQSAPIIDAAPVVRGRWTWSPEYCKWICSECGGREGECEAPICKWCGARMDGGEEDGKA